MTEADSPHVVKAFTVGSTRIKIADNYCRGRGKDEVERTLEEIARTAQAYLSAAAEPEKEKHKRKDRKKNGEENEISHQAADYSAGTGGNSGGEPCGLQDDYGDGNNRGSGNGHTQRKKQ